jgi:Co/Zn/Cd efflux system component
VLSYHILGPIDESLRGGTPFLLYHQNSSGKMSNKAGIALLDTSSFVHSHNFLGKDHERNEWRAWVVIALCTSSMVIEITCGIKFGSLALIADGIHMSTHAFAFLITALSYSYARMSSSNERFVFGTSKVGELSSYTCALILVGVAGYILFQGITRIIHPDVLHFKEALPVAFVGLCVNIASAFVLLGGCTGKSDHDAEIMAHGHSHGHATHEFLEGLDELEMGTREDHHHFDHDHFGHDHAHSHDHDETRSISTTHGNVVLSIFEDGVPPEFRIKFDTSTLVSPQFTVTTFRDKQRLAETFQFVPSHDESYLWRSTTEIPEPHSFDVELVVEVGGTKEIFPLEFREASEHELQEEEQAGLHDHDHDHGHNQGKRTKQKYEMDNNFRGALLHVVADAFVSVLAIVSIAIAGNVKRAYFLDPVAGIVGALVIISWGYQLCCDSMIALLDIVPDRTLNDKLKHVLEADQQSRVTDLHIWKLGPGNLAVVMSVATVVRGRSSHYYKKLIGGVKALAHVTVEVNHMDNSSAQSSEKLL